MSQDRSMKQLLCRQRVGAKIQCTSCYTAYHPLCARLAGLHMEILDGGDSGEEVPVSPACPKRPGRPWPYQSRRQLCNHTLPG